MRERGLRPRRKRRFKTTTDSRHSLPVAKNRLNRQFEPEAPNRTWAADLTYVWTSQGWLYLAVVLDLFSRRVVGWSMALIIAVPVGGMVMHQWLQSFAYRVSIDGTLILTTIGISILITLIAVSYKALKAASVNPVDCLKYH